MPEHNLHVYCEFVLFLCSISLSLSLWLHFSVPQLFIAEECLFGCITHQITIFILCARVSFSSQSFFSTCIDGNLWYTIHILRATMNGIGVEGERESESEWLTHKFDVIRAQQTKNQPKLSYDPAHNLTHKEINKTNCRFVVLLSSLHACRTFKLVRSN